jgi:hypothetical protein
VHFLAQRFLPFQDQIEFSADIFQDHFQVSSFPCRILTT